MVVNGQRYAYREGLTLRGLLDELRIDHARVVVMHGDEIYRRNDIPDVAVECGGV